MRRPREGRSHTFRALSVGAVTNSLQLPAIQTVSAPSRLPSPGSVAATRQVSKVKQVAPDEPASPRRRRGRKSTCSKPSRPTSWWQQIVSMPHRRANRDQPAQRF